MCSKLFSSLILRELIYEIEHTEGGASREHERWAETITTKYGQELQEHPVVYLTEAENHQAREHLISYEKINIDVAETATNLIRGKHGAEINEFLKTRHHGWPLFAKQENAEEDHYKFPSDDQAPACFKEWYAVASVSRLTLAMPEISYQDAMMGTAECLIHPLPRSWEEKLEECLKITEDSAIVPVPKGWDPPLKRRDIDSILPAGTVHESSLLTNGIISAWFQILLVHREKSKPGCTVIVPPDSLDLAGSTPREVAEKKVMINAAIDMVMFPTVSKEQDHCVMVVAYPRRRVIVILDPQGSGSTKRLQQDRPWMKERPRSKSGEWEVMWLECPHQRAEAACGVLMLINALFLIEVENPAKGYTHQDVMFLQRYVAAVICMGKLPDKVFKCECCSPKLKARG